MSQVNATRRPRSKRPRTQPTTNQCGIGNQVSDDRGSATLAREWRLFHHRLEQSLTLQLHNRAPRPQLLSIGEPASLQYLGSEHFVGSEPLRLERTVELSMLFPPTLLIGASAESGIVFFSPASKTSQPATWPHAFERMHERGQFASSITIFS